MKYVDSVEAQEVYEAAEHRYRNACNSCPGSNAGHGRQAEGEERGVSRYCAHIDCVVASTLDNTATCFVYVCCLLSADDRKMHLQNAAVVLEYVQEFYDLKVEVSRRQHNSQTCNVALVCSGSTPLLCWLYFAAQLCGLIVSCTSTESLVRCAHQSHMVQVQVLLVHAHDGAGHNSPAVSCSQLHKHDAL